MLGGSLAGRDVCALSLAGAHGGQPPAEPEALLEFARYLPLPGAYQAVRNGGWCEDRVSSRCPASVRRRRERLTRSHSACW
ncbi:hypothetical protein ABGB18_01100 [Nonomuraea sp. B12E4]|uniref:hypothetical protein n=1 Tax=Nonomuraea sp. B12E4 TaxID=3153564 RepID=UPI00325E23ED